MLDKDTSVMKDNAELCSVQNFVETLTNFLKTFLNHGEKLS